MYQQIIKPVPDGFRDCDILTGIITSDFQVRTRWGWMGFENQYWSNDWRKLVYPYMMVDINHHNNTASGYLLSMEDIICDDYSRIQADWTTPRPMHAVVASFMIPHDTQCKKIVDEGLRKGQIGISIEHGGRKPKRFIGPYVTLCHKPWNKDAWVVCARINDEFHKHLYTRDLPLSLTNLINKHYTNSMEILNGK